MQKGIRLKGIFKLLPFETLEPIITDNNRKIKLRGACNRGSHTSITFEFLNKDGVRFTNRDATRAKRLLKQGGYVLGQRVIKTNDNIIVRLYFTDTAEDNARTISVLALDGKDVQYSSKVQEIVESKNTIAIFKNRCNSRTGMHWTDYYLIIAYPEAECKVDGKHNTCRGNLHDLARVLKCE